MTSQESKRSPLHLLPTTVSQLLSASQVKDAFMLCDWELNQVSIVGVVRGFAPFVTNVRYSVDDMTGPPLDVTQWIDAEDVLLAGFAPPGTYVKVIGSLRSFSGQRSLLAMSVRCLTDQNEITSHMLEVVRAHVQLFGKVFDVNMNVAARPGSVSLSGLSGVQHQVLHKIRRFSGHHLGISLTDLKTQLDDVSMTDIRASLVTLVNEGHAFYTIDEQHFKSAVG